MIKFKSVEEFAAWIEYLADIEFILIETNNNTPRWSLANGNSISRIVCGKSAEPFATWAVRPIGYMLNIDENSVEIAQMDGTVVKEIAVKRL